MPRHVPRLFPFRKLVFLLLVCSLKDAGGLSFDLVPGWPMGIHSDGKLPFVVGQVSGVAITSDGSGVVLFHRNVRQWDEWAFDESNQVREEYRKPISGDTLVWVNRESGKVEKKGGENLFFLPHGITIDTEDNMWITDVGSHQMYKLNSDMKVVLTLGEKFVPGSDKRHFCKPTDVAVQPDGSFFVGDGYCNSRIMEYNSGGDLVKIISISASPNNDLVPPPRSMFIVHSIDLDLANNLLYVADRENGRVLVFDSVTGVYKNVIRAPNEGAIYTVRYRKDEGGLVYFVTGRRGDVTTGMGYTYSVKDGTFVHWSIPGGFSLAHAMAVSRDNQEVFVVEIHPDRAWKFLKHTTKEHQQKQQQQQQKDDGYFFHSSTSKVW